MDYDELNGRELGTMFECQLVDLSIHRRLGFIACLIKAGWRKRDEGQCLDIGIDMRGEHDDAPALQCAVRDTLMLFSSDSNHRNQMN